MKCQETELLLPGWKNYNGCNLYLFVNGCQGDKPTSGLCLLVEALNLESRPSVVERRRSSRIMYFLVDGSSDFWINTSAGGPLRGQFRSPNACPGRSS